MQEYKHWATELQIGDRAVATIRHISDGSKNIHGAIVIVVANNYYDKVIKGAFCGKVYDIPYCELQKHEPHEVSKVKCYLCNSEWVAVRPKETPKLECPNCKNVANFENIDIDE